MQFWQQDYLDPSTPQVQGINQEPIVQPNPPFRLKGGRIVLFEGQRIKAGSFVYSSIQNTNNVCVPQYFPPNSKELKLDLGERDTILGEFYGKFQANQGGVIVVVSEDGKEPPMPPPCCQPIGIIMEEIVGFGTPEQIDGQDEYWFQGEYGVARQKYYGDTFENVCQLQGREILVKIFPMYADYYMNGVCGTVVPSLEQSWPIHVSSCLVPDDTGDYASDMVGNIYPRNIRVKSNFMNFHGIYTGELKWDDQDIKTNERTSDFMSILNNGVDRKPYFYII